MAHDGQDLAFQLENSATIVDLLEKTREASAALKVLFETAREQMKSCLLYTSPSPRD